MKSYSSPERTGPHYATLTVSFPLEIGGRRYELVPLTQALKTNPALSKVSEFTGKAWMNAPPPPNPPLLSCVFFLFCFPNFPSTSVSWNITAGQRSPSLRSARLHNENKWAGSKVCCVPHYTSQAIGFHQKLRWIVSPNAHINAFQCFIYLMWISKALSKGLNIHLCPIWNITLLTILYKAKNLRGCWVFSGELWMVQ